MHALTLGGLLLSGVLFTACNKDTFNDDVNQDAAGLMAFNLASEKSVNYAISNNLINNQPLAFGSYTGGYVSIYPGNRPVTAYDYATGDTLATASYDFALGKYYSVFTVGSGDAFQNVIVHDNYDSLSSSSGNAYIRYINAISGSTSPNVKVTVNGTDVVNTTAPFASVSEFVAVTPGNASIAVTEGSINATRTITTEQKKVYTVLLSPGATSAEPAQIKYIVNGELDDEEPATSSSARAVSSN